MLETFMGHDLTVITIFTAIIVYGYSSFTFYKIWRYRMNLLDIYDRLRTECRSEFKTLVSKVNENSDLFKTYTSEFEKICTELDEIFKIKDEDLTGEIIAKASDLIARKSDINKELRSINSATGDYFKNYYDLEEKLNESKDNYDAAAMETEKMFKLSIIGTLISVTVIIGMLFAM